MKTLIIFSLFLLSCNKIVNSKTDSLLENEKVKGIWKLCITKGNGRIIHSNICKTVIFHEDKRGELYMEDKLICNFVWHTNQHKILLLTNISSDQNKLLSGDSRYTFRLYEEEEIKYLEIKPKDKEIYYLLTQARKW